jgi:hypothetical protein
MILISYQAQVNIGGRITDRHCENKGSFLSVPRCFGAVPKDVCYFINQ